MLQAGQGANAVWELLQRLAERQTQMLQSGQGANAVWEQLQ